MNVYESPKPSRKIAFAVIALLMIVAGIVLTVVMKQRWASRPQLDLRNAGKTPVLVRMGDEDLVVRPEETSHWRFSEGDSIRIFSDVRETSRSKSFTLEKRGALQGDPPLVAAELSVNEQGSITLRYGDGTEVVK
jgi:hypothetical protein